MNQPREQCVRDAVERGHRALADLVKTAKPQPGYFLLTPLVCLFSRWKPLPSCRVPRGVGRVT